MFGELILKILVNMKRVNTIVSLILLVLIPTFGMMAQGSAKKVLSNSKETTTMAAGPIASWDTTAVDLGKIIFKTKKKAEYKLTNAGNQPLFIVYGQASCGCAHLDYSEAPIMPGKSTTVTVTYHGTDLGEFMKTITMVTNADTDRTILQIKGNVVEE